MKSNTKSIVESSASKSKQRSQGSQEPRCPKCGKKISSLYYGRYLVEMTEYTLATDLDTEDFATDETGEEDFECPECGEKLFYNEEDAERFLRGVEN